MPNYAEVIYEPGSKSVVSYETDAELQAALKEHHNRAVSGEAGGPAGHNAERVSKVILYGTTHPGDDNSNVNATNVGSLVSGMTKADGSLDAHQLISALRDEMSPVYPQDQGRHESMYKANGQEMDLSFLNSGDTSA